jgi:homeobox protein cut-like
MVRTKALEARIAELESEASSLLRSLESQKVAFGDIESRLKKRVEEVGRELAQRVSYISPLESRVPIVLQESEVETLKGRLRTYADYDEIKRELEIMKVCLPTVIRFNPLTLVPVR